MKKLKSVLLAFISCAVLLASCGGLPTQTTPIKANGIKLSNADIPIYKLAIDKEDSLYFIDKNVIKKATSNGDLSIVGGKETPDPYVENADIDGDVKTAKFGEIRNVTYVEKDNSLYFIDAFSIGKNEDMTSYNYIRKITNNIVKTVFKLETIKGQGSMEIYLSPNAEIYISDINFIKKTDLISGKITHILGNLDKDNTRLGDVSLVDNEGAVYELIYNYSSHVFDTLYVMVNDKWKKLFSDSSIRISIDKYNNLYVLENTARYNIDNEKISPLNSQLLLHKIPKKKIIETTGEIYLGYKEYVIGELVQNSGYGFISSNDGTKIYGLDENSIYKINTGDNK